MAKTITRKGLFGGTTTKTVTKRPGYKKVVKVRERKVRREGYPATKRVTVVRTKQERGKVPTTGKVATQKRILRKPSPFPVKPVTVRPIKPKRKVVRKRTRKVEFLPKKPRYGARF